MVSPMRYYDSDTGQVIEVKTSQFYTIIKVSNMEFFFNRESGKYDGFGAMEKEIPV